MMSGGSATLLYPEQLAATQRFDREHHFRRFFKNLLEVVSALNAWALDVEDHWLALPYDERLQLKHLSETLDEWLSSRPKANAWNILTILPTVIGLVMTHGTQLFAYPIAIARFQAAMSRARVSDRERASDAWAALLTPAALEQTARIDEQRAARQTVSISAEDFRARTS